MTIYAAPGYFLKTENHRGLNLAVTMGMFSINGYVELLPGHPWLELDYMDIPADVHGGITYKEGALIGFDTAHAGDDVWTQEEVLTEARHLADQAANATK